MNNIKLVMLITTLLCSCTGLKKVNTDTKDVIIPIAETERIISTLASDDFGGRKIFSEDIEKASKFIENEFEKTGLEYLPGLKSYRQEFLVNNAKANNVVGFIKGKSRPEEYVIFSAHYDHLGKSSNAGSRTKNDVIFNGANDDASGTTAVIQLATFFKNHTHNERSIIFVAFTGEEFGGYGSKEFSKKLNPGKIVAMFNVEMIGTPSKWGKNSAYITGYQMTNFGDILNKNLSGSDAKFYEDPYPNESLFYRSDNATLAELGVPAHTLSTAKMDQEPYYHSVDDEVSTLDLTNMNNVIKSIAISAQSIISGKDTPNRIKN